MSRSVLECSIGCPIDVSCRGQFMIDAICHAIGVQDVPIGALLRRAGLDDETARIVESVLQEFAIDDAMLDDSAVEVDDGDDPERGSATALAAFLDGAVPPPIRLGSEPAAIASTIAGLAPASMLGGSSFDSVAQERVKLAGRLAAPGVAPVVRALASLLDGRVATASAALAATGDEQRGLVLCFGFDAEYALGERPRRTLDRQIGRLFALAQGSGGRLVPVVPCDPARPEGVAIVRESLTRGALGACVTDRPIGAGGALRGQAAARGHAWDRDCEHRLLDLFACCIEHHAPLFVVIDHPLGVQPMHDRHSRGRRGRGRSGTDPAQRSLDTWIKRLDHRRFAELKIALVLAGRMVDGTEPAAAHRSVASGSRKAHRLRLSASAKAALSLSGQDERIACVLPVTQGERRLDEFLWRTLGTRLGRGTLATRVVLGSGLPWTRRTHAEEGLAVWTDSSANIALSTALRRGGPLAAHARRLRFGNAVTALALRPWVQERGPRLLSERALAALRARIAGRRPPAPAVVVTRPSAISQEARAPAADAPPTGARSTRLTRATGSARRGRSAEVTRARGGARTPGAAGAAGTARTAAASAGWGWDCDCLVLGAGIAGLAAARDLSRPRRVRQTARHVIVVEGSDRIGGRLHTLRRWPEGPLELGAELIHRPRHDQVLGGFSLWDELDRGRLATRSIQKLQASHVHFESWRTSGPLLRAGCGMCSDMDVAKALDALSRICALTSGTDREAGAMMADLLAGHPMPRDNAEAMADLLLTGTVPGRLGELSSAGLAFDKVKDQELSSEEFHVSLGFDAMTSVLARGQDVRLGFDIQRIAWGPAGPGGGVEVAATDGRVLRARAALCTFSIGVLRDGLSSGRLRFEPALPPEKREAIDRLESGPISKIVMRFDRAFWPSGMSLLANPRRDRRGPRSYFVPLFGVVGAAPVLTALCNGRDAREIDARVGGRAEVDSAEALPPELRSAVDEFVARIVADLRGAFDPTSSQPEPQVQRWCVRSWGNDPWTRGGTSFIRFEPGVDSREVGQLRARLADHRPTLPLYWAGEATAQGTNPWSVHGAHQSGIDAAKYLHAFLDLPARVRVTVP